MTVDERVINVPDHHAGNRLGFRLRRLGCFLALLIWFVLLLLPCFAIFLISQGEVNIQTGDLPGQTLRVWIIEGVRERGIGISSPQVLDAGVQNRSCLITSTHFLLWMGESEPTQVCECYDKQSDASWSPVEALVSVCMPEQ